MSSVGASLQLLIRAANYAAIADNSQDWLKLITALVQVIGGGGILGILTLLLTKTFPWLWAKIESRSIERRVGAELFTAANIERSIRYFVPSDCQSIDPAGGEEPRLVYAVREPLLKAIDNALMSPTQYRYLFLLADSGMGKTTTLLNYYVRHIRRWRRKFNLVLIPLGIPDADARIEKVENKESTVLFLDALDEDTLAIVDHAERLKILLNLTRSFSRVLITCRTQFFPKEEEIPQETGIIKIGARAAGDPAEYVFHKIYASPFSDRQVAHYIRRRYPFWQWRRRRAALRMAQKIPNLTARPMLLAHIDELVLTKREIQFSVELYEEMINAWLEREKGSVQRVKKSETEKEDLRKFSERLAVELYVNRAMRGAERIPKAELAVLAGKWNIALDEWKLSGRSLLNRDASGNYKFAHRSIMEYLFVKRIFRDDPVCWQADWTDQMNMFVWEVIFCYYPQKTLKSLKSLDVEKLIRAIVSIQKHILTNKAYCRFMREFANYLLKELLAPAGHIVTYAFWRQQHNATSGYFNLLGGATSGIMFSGKGGSDSALRRLLDSMNADKGSTHDRTVMEVLIKPYVSDGKLVSFNDPNAINAKWEEPRGSTFSIVALVTHKETGQSIRVNTKKIKTLKSLLPLLAEASSHWP